MEREIEHEMDNCDLDFPSEHGVNGFEFKGGDSNARVNMDPIGINGRVLRNLISLCLEEIMIQLKQYDYTISNLNLSMNRGLFRYIQRQC